METVTTTPNSLHVPWNYRINTYKNNNLPLPHDIVL